jgi:hypothetical protein
MKTVKNNIIGLIKSLLLEKSSTGFFFFFSLPFLALFFPIKGSFVFSCGLLGLYMVFYCLQNKFFVKFKIFEDKKIIILISAFLYFVVLFLLKKGERYSLFDYFWGLEIILCLLIFKFKNRKEFLDFVVSLLIVTFVLYMIVAYGEFVFGIRQPRSRLLMSENPLQKYISTGTFTNENDFASYLMMSLAFFSLYYKKKVYVFFMIIAGILICLADSRINLICIIVLLYMYCLFLIKGNKKRFFFFILTTIAVVLIAHFFIIPNIDHFQSSGDILSIKARIKLISIAFEDVLVQKNFWGYGVGSFASMMISKNYKELVPDGATDPHCWYIELLVEGGIVVFFFLIVFIIKFLITLIKKFSESNDSMHKYMLCVFSVFLLTVFSSSRFSPNIWNWFFFGVFVKYYQLVQKEQQ